MFSFSSRRSSSSSVAVSSQQDVDSTTDSPSSSRPASPHSSSTTEEDPLSTDRSRGDPDPGSSERSSGNPEKMDPVQVSTSLDASELNPGVGSRRDHPDRSLTSSDESSTPVASITCSPSSSTSGLHEDQNEDQSAGRKPSHDTLQTSSTLYWTGSREFSAPALRFTRQLSVGGLGSSTGVHLNQNYHPFPNRKTPRISEAARRLGMYSSF